MSQVLVVKLDGGMQAVPDAGVIVQVACVSKDASDVQQGLGHAAFVTDLPPNSQRLLVHFPGTLQIPLLFEDVGDVVQSRRHGKPISDFSKNRQRLLIHSFRTGQIPLLPEQHCRIGPCTGHASSISGRVALAFSPITSTFTGTWRQPWIV